MRGRAGANIPVVWSSALGVEQLDAATHDRNKRQGLSSVTNSDLKP